MSNRVNLPNFFFEDQLNDKGYMCIAGLDEVGRGSFAGPVVCGCVVLGKINKHDFKDIRIDDSKKLTHLQRVKADQWIRKNALTYAVGLSSAAVINRLGIVKATNIAYRKAIVQANLRLGKEIDYLLVDAFYIPYVKGLNREKQMAIVKGDGKVLSIAAASIVAKVYRDRLMTDLTKKYPYYGWGENKGYGTFKHRHAIEKYGINRYHRRKYLKFV